MSAKMRTIVFYSFKGGTGRSLAVAQLAILLKDLGRKVFVLDFDLGAPGQAEKLGPALRWNARPHYGLVEYLSRHQGNRPLEALDTKLVTVDTLKLLVCGDPFAKDEDYWKTYLAPDFQKFLALESSSDRLILDLKAKIEADHSPEFLLVDAPSGVSRIAAMAIQLLADSVVFLSANHDEGLMGTNFHLRQIHKNKMLGRRSPQDVFCVLSRVPRHFANQHGFHSTPDAQIEQIRYDALRTINFGLSEDARVSNLYQFSSEPLVELQESLPMQDPRMDGSHLVQDYVQFFSELIPELKQPLESRKQLRRRLRPFMLIEDEGRMVNPADDSPNVALRVDTLVSTFVSIVQAVSDQAGEPAAGAVLFHAGWTAATRFSKYLGTHWAGLDETRRSKLMVSEKLTEWCEFDSTVGFGRFTHKLWGNGREGVIELEQNFLVLERTEGPSVCSFMSGYVTRVLETVFQDKVTVLHADEDCGLHNHSEKCLFRFVS